MLRNISLVGLLMASMLGAAVAGSNDARLPDAAQQRDAAAVSALLKQGVDVNSAAGDGTTALHWAANNGDIEMTRQLIAAGANVNAASRIGAMTPLYMASRQGHAAVIETLLKAGANAKDANANGTTVLMIAAGAGNAEAVRVLLDNGADINAADNTNGQTALMFAAALNRTEVIKALLGRGAVPNLTTKVFSLVRTPKPPADAPAGANQAQPQGQQNQAAAQQNRRGGTNPTVIGGLTALHFAAREGQMDAIRALITGGANVNTVAAGDHTSPITTALINGHIDIAKVLLEHGADPNIGNIDGLTPLYAAIDIRWRNNAWYPQPSIEQEQTNYLDFMKALLDRGANVNARLSKKLWYRKFRYSDDWVDPNGATAFWRAAQANDIAAMRLLAAHGANPSIPTVRGVTPLMVAAGLGFEYQTTNIMPDARLEAARYLVDELSLDVNARDEQHYTTLHGAAYVGDNEVIKYLVAQGGDVKARSKGRLEGTSNLQEVGLGKGDTVADMANGPREKSLLHSKTVALLEAMGSENSHDCRSTACVNNVKPDKPTSKQ